jgi:hypothetical protein
MDILKRLATLRAACGTLASAGLPEAVARTAAPAAQEAAAAAAQEQRALAHAQEHTRAGLAEVLAALSPEQRQQLDQRAAARLTLQEHDIGYGLMLRVAREEILLHEQLGFDGWPRLVAQVRARGGDQAGDDVLAACRLEAILDDVLVVSVPTAQDKRRLTEHYLGVLEELASTTPQRTRIRVLVR